MPDMVDAVDPANIDTALDGAPALRITVLADPAGEAFDAEPGNAGDTAVAGAVHARLAAGRWAVGYINLSGCGALTAALAAWGIEWASAERWPEPGCYLWAADPSQTGWYRTSLPGVTPLAVQNRWRGTVDVSTVADNFPARVAGYIDGARSAWPAEQWARFTTIAEPTPDPDPDPLSDRTGHNMPFIAKNGTGPEAAFYEGGVLRPIISGATLESLSAAGYPVVTMAPEDYAAWQQPARP